ncbi:MAG TPA: AmmeMemoRadiSam system protein B [Kiritimatiellia bacterium]|nr:AmmeMemoRadiSam system protein B [Kiritimatiellia bacterium]HMO99143.1 AmmeMemoRadiSam system protein B [Kiritimatiellia bacterium]HMP95679.1 AmmeMemoRadiSam system protein B [Kiritimatiellia bacterium]
MKTRAVRPPAVAGMFYPSDPEELQVAVATCLAHARGTERVRGPVKALIAPHAGYVYSGPIAGSAYACLSPFRDRIRRVVLLGPSHRVGFRGIALSSAAAFRTPLGEAPLDDEINEALASLDAVVVYDRAHQDEHGLEVHLPFLQMTLASFTLAPIVVGDASPREISGALERVWGGPETLVVVSSDLSHYLPYDEAVRIDQVTTEAIERLDVEGVGPEQACGRLPVQGLLQEAQRHHLTATAVDVRNSGDTAGDKRQVVGYGAYVFTS